MSSKEIPSPRQPSNLFFSILAWRLSVYLIHQAVRSLSPQLFARQRTETPTQATIGAKSSAAAGSHRASLLASRTGNRLVNPLSNLHQSARSLSACRGERTAGRVEVPSADIVSSNSDNRRGHTRVEGGEDRSPRCTRPLRIGFGGESKGKGEGKDGGLLTCRHHFTLICTSLPQEQ